MIRFENVTKLYGDNVGLKHVSVHIQKGEFVFLVGSSGAGKSTFVKLISKELNPEEGMIFIDGKDVTNLSAREIPKHRRKIGMVFQDFRLIPNKTVYENIAFAMEILHKSPRTIRRSVNNTLELMGISDIAKKFPDEVSGGEQQRVAIARAIINNPDILIADEPTGNLDPDITWEVMQNLETINRTGTTVLVVTHEKDIVNKMNKRVIAIEGGYIIKDDGKGVYDYDA